MGCDIHSHAEKQTENGWQVINGLYPFNWRSYSMYGFLAGVRNYSAITPISEPRGFPKSSPLASEAEDEEWHHDFHSVSWLTVSELVNFDYDKPMEDRRFAKNGNGRCTCDPGEGEQTTYGEFLGEMFFVELEKLRVAGADRIVFWFDN